MTAPGGERGYQVRSRDWDAKRLLVILGSRRKRAAVLESALNALLGEPVETWAKNADGQSHVVVRMPLFDVHLMGNVTLPQALATARALQPIAPSGADPWERESNE